MKYLILCFTAGFVLGLLVVYIWNRKHALGTLRIYDQEGDVSVFMELECELPELRSKNTVSLRVENTSLYEN